MMRAVLLAVVGSVVAISGAWAGPFAGKYEGKTPHGVLYVTVKKAGGDQYKVDLKSVVRGVTPCVEGWVATGTFRGKVFVETPAVAPDLPDICPVRITSGGKSIRVVETGGGCDHRNAMCSFNGSVTSRR